MAMRRGMYLWLGTYLYDTNHTTSYIFTPTLPLSPPNFHLNRKPFIPSMPTYPNTFSSYNVQSRASTSNLLARYSTLSITKLLILGVGNLPLLRAAPTYLSPFIKTTTEKQPSTAQGPALWVYLSVAVVLVLLGGAFAGLTIALMGQVWCSKDYITSHNGQLSWSSPPLGWDLFAGHWEIWRGLWKEARCQSAEITPKRKALGLGYTTSWECDYQWNPAHCTRSFSRRRVASCIGQYRTHW